MKRNFQKTRPMRTPEPDLIRWLLKRGGVNPIVGNYNTSIKRGLYRGGVPVRLHQKVLQWAIGDDFYDLSLEKWPERLKARHNFVFNKDVTIIKIMIIVAQKWRHTHNA